MKRVMCLRFLNWPVQRRQRQLPAEHRSKIAIHTALNSPSTTTTKRKKAAADADLPFVREVFRSARGGPAIVSVSDDSWKAGVRPGMPLAEARSMATPLTPRTTKSKTVSNTETQFFEWSPADDRQELCRIADLTRRFAPIVGLDVVPVPDSLLLDITGCGPLFGGESSLAEQLLHRLQKNGLACRAAISDSVAASWAFTHSTGHLLQQTQILQRQPRATTSADWELPIVVIPPGQAESWLHPLPIAAARIPVGDIDLLAQLGILNIKQLFGLPVEDLPSRLSASAVSRIHQLRGIDEELIDPIPEPNPITSTWVSEVAASNHHEIRQVLEHLTTEIVEQLKRRSAGAIRLTCRLINEQRQSVPLVAEAIRPLQTAKEFIEILKLRLETLRVRDPIFSIHMQATAAPLPVARQRDLFSSTEHVVPTEELATVINRLSNRLGKDAVVTATSSDDPTPERTIDLRPVLNSDEGISGLESRLEDLVTPMEHATPTAAPPNRPLRLLPSPARLNSQSSPLRNSFQWSGTQYQTKAVVGPERIQTQWWHETTVHRDYYRVQTTVGSEFWIFQDLSNKTWFLHGIFD